MATTHYNNIFNKKNVEFSIEEKSYNLPYKYESDVELKVNQILFNPVNEAFQKLLDNDLYNDALLKQYIEEGGEGSGPLTADSLSAVLNSSGEGKKFVVSGESGISVVHKVGIPVEETLSGRFLNGKKVNEVTFVGETFIAATDDGVYTSKNKTSWTKVLQAAGVDFVDICYNYNYLLNSESIISRFDWLILGNSNDKIRFFGHDGSTDKWIDFATNTDLAKFNFQGLRGTHLYSFEGDSKIYLGTRGSGLYGFYGYRNEKPLKENGTRRWIINDFVEIDRDEANEKYLLATDNGIKQSRYFEGFRNLKETMLFDREVYVYDVVEHGNYTYVATNVGLAKIDGSTITWQIQNMPVLNLIIYDGTVYAACGTNGIWKLLDSDSFAKVLQCTALKIVALNGDLLVLRGNKPPIISYVRHGKETFNSIDGLSFSNSESVKDMILHNDSIYIVTDHGIKEIEIGEQILGFDRIKNSSLNESKIKFSKTLRNGETIIQDINGNIYKLDNVFSALEKYLTHSKTLKDAIKPNSGNNYYFLDVDGNLYSDAFLAEGESLDSSLISTSINAISWLNSRKALIYMVGDGTTILSSGEQKERINISQYIDIGTNDYNIFAIDSNKHLYSFSDKSLPSISSLAGNEQWNVDFSRKTKLLYDDESDDVGEVPLYLKASTISVSISSDTDLFSDKNYFDDAKPVSIDVSFNGQNQIKAVDYIGYATQAKNNREPLLINQGSTLSVFSIVPRLALSSYVDEEIEDEETEESINYVLYYVSSDLVLEKTLANYNVKQFSDIDNKYNVILSANGSVHKKEPILTDVYVDGSDYDIVSSGSENKVVFFDALSSIHSCFVLSGQTLVGTDHGIYSIVKNSTNGDYIVGDNNLEESRIDSISRVSSDGLIAIVKADLPISSSQIFYKESIDSDSWDPSMFDSGNSEKTKNLNVDGAGILDVTSKKLSVGTPERLDIRPPSGSAILSSLYINGSNKCVVGSTNGNHYRIDYDGSSNAYSFTQVTEQSIPFEELMASKKANFFKVDDGLSVVGLSSSYKIPAKFGGLANSGRELVLSSQNDENALLFFKSIDTSLFYQYDLSIRDFLLSLNLSCDYSQSHNYSLSTKVICDNGTRRNEILSVFSLQNSSNDVKLSTAYMYSEDILNGLNNARNLSVSVFAYIGGGSTLSADYSITAVTNESATELKYPTLETTNGYTYTEVANPVQYYGYIVKHPTSNKYLFLNYDSTIVSYPEDRFDVYEEENQYSIVHVNKSRFLSTTLSIDLNRPKFNTEYVLSGNLSDSFGHVVPNYVLSNTTQVIIDGVPQYEYGIVSSSYVLNNNFNDCIYFKPEEQNLHFTGISERVDQSTDDALTSMSSGTISSIASTKDSIFMLRTNGDVYRLDSSNFPTPTKINGISNAIKIATTKSALYALPSTKNRVYEYSVDSGVVTTHNVTTANDIIVSDDKPYYKKNSILYPLSSSTGISVPNLANLINFDSDIFVYRDCATFKKSAFDFSTGYSSISQLTGIQSIATVGNKYLLAATSSQIKYVNADAINTVRVLPNAQFSAIKTIAVTEDNKLIVIDGQDIYISDDPIVDDDGNIEQNISFIKNIGGAFALNLQMPIIPTNYTGDDDVLPPLLINDGNHYCISYTNKFIEDGILSTFNTNLVRFIEDSSGLYVLGNESIYRLEGEEWSNTPIPSSAQIDYDDFIVRSKDEYWSISANKPLQISGAMLSGYSSIEIAPTGLFKNSESIYYYTSLSSGIYGQSSLATYSSDNLYKLSSENKNVFALKFFNGNNYVYNYTFSALVSGYGDALEDSSLPGVSDVSTIIRVSAFDSNLSSLEEAVNRDYVTTEGMATIDQIGNYLFFSNGGDGYIYHLRTHLGEHIIFDQLDNMNGGSSILTFSRNSGKHYLGYGNLLATIEGFAKTRYFGEPTADLTILANNFRSGTNKIVPIKNDTDFLIGSNFGLKFVYDKLMTRSFYDRENRAESINGNVTVIESTNLAETDYCFVVAQGNEIYEVTGLRIPTFRKIMTLKADETITDIFVLQKNEYLIATTKGLYTTNNRSTIVNDLSRFTLNTVYQIINEELAKVIKNHVDEWHNKDSFITKLNKKADNRINFLSTEDKHLDKYDYTIANGVRVIQNDMIDTIELGGGDSADSYVKVAFSNWATKSIETESFYSDGGFVSKFVDPTSGKVFDSSNVPYIVKTWMSGIKEIYVYVPSTATYYINNPVGLTNSLKAYNPISRANVPGVSNVNSLPDNCTSLRVYLYNSHFGIRTILAAQCVGNSLPLKIYKDNANADDSWKGFFDTVVQPSALRTLPKTSDRNVNNVRVCTDDLNRIYLDFSIYGTDAQAIRIIAE